MSGAFLRTMILPSLPLTMLLACFALAIGYQDSFWLLVTATRPESATLPSALTFVSFLIICHCEERSDKAIYAVQK